MKVIVIGAGASGLMSAYACAKNGNKVLILEKNEKVGKKLYITGKGRCNVTNNCDANEFLNNVVNNSKFLYSSLNEFSPSDTISFIENNGVKLKTERGNRVFPTSDKSSDIIKALKNACTTCGVEINLNEEVIDIDKSDKFKVKTSKNTYVCDAVIVCCGGYSYKATGSTGFGYKLAKKFGHTLVDIKPGLSPIKIKDKFVSDVEGLSLKNVELSAYYNGKCIKKLFGEMLFTRDGISGPIVLSMSSYINKFKDVELCLDLKPALSEEKLENRLIREFDVNKNSQINTVMKNLLPSSLILTFLDYCNIPSNLKVNSIKVEQRKTIVHNLKHFKLNFDRLYDIDYAIITSGGVSVKEINPKTMESKLASNLYFAGEVLDVDALTGGFNIQIALSTGYCAGKGVNYGCGN